MVNQWSARPAINWWELFAINPIHPIYPWAATMHADRTLNDTTAQRPRERFYWRFAAPIGEDFKSTRQLTDPAKYIEGGIYIYSAQAPRSRAVTRTFFSIRSANKIHGGQCIANVSSTVFTVVAGVGFIFAK
ncbi:hypothetical protein BDZ91DRAFT_768883 [Kalaharituber pfeilii]|nr:hypothetical protein BDZ91DRAFT_768883 [Kalaharituber pfeilii]